MICYKTLKKIKRCKYSTAAAVKNQRKHDSDDNKKLLF